MMTGVIHRVKPGIIIVSMVVSIAVSMVAVLLAANPFAHAGSKTQEFEQVGAYSQLENAATMVESYRMEGKNAFIRQKTVNGMLIFAVIIDHSAPPVEAEPAPETEMEAAPDPEAMPETEPAMEAPVAAVEAITETTAEPMAEPTPEPTPEEDAQEVEELISEPYVVIVPVASAQKTESIEITSDTELYDRPFATGKPLGTYHELGGVFVKEYLGWYAIKVDDDRFGFIRMQDATPVSKDGS